MRYQVLIYTQKEAHSEILVIGPGSEVGRQKEGTKKLFFSLLGGKLVHLHAVYIATYYKGTYEPNTLTC